MQVLNPRKRALICKGSDRTQASLNLDFMKGTRFEAKVVDRAKLAEHLVEGGAGDHPVRMQLEDKTLKSATDVLASLESSASEASEERTAQLETLFVPLREEVVHFNQKLVGDLVQLTGQ